MAQCLEHDAAHAGTGNIDELNSGLGVARTFCAEDENGLEEILVELQCCLTELMSHIATPPYVAEQASIMGLVLYALVPFDLAPLTP